MEDANGVRFEGSVGEVTEGFHSWDCVITVTSDHLVQSKEGTRQIKIHQLKRERNGDGNYKTTKHTSKLERQMERQRRWNDSALTPFFDAICPASGSFTKGVLAPNMVQFHASEA
jgi:hypothetical protein